MEYIQGLSVQTEIFLYALGFGFLLGILYDVFRTVRMIISNSRAFVLFMDLLYFAVCAFLLFCFNMIVDSGHIRVYILLGELLGWLIYYFSFGAIAIKVAKAVTGFFKKLFSAIFKPIEKLVKRIGRKMRKRVGNCKKIMRKNEKKTKFILQKYKNIVYNLNSYIESSVFKKQKEK